MVHVLYVVRLDKHVELNFFLDETLSNPDCLHSSLELFGTVGATEVEGVLVLGNANLQVGVCVGGQQQTPPAGMSTKVA